MWSEPLDETEAEYQRRLDREARRHRTPWWKRLYWRMRGYRTFDNVDDLIAWLNS